MAGYILGAGAAIAALAGLSKLKAKAGCSAPSQQQGPRAISTLGEQFTRLQSVSYDSDPFPDSVYQSIYNSIVDTAKHPWPGDRFTFIVLGSMVARHVWYFNNKVPQYNEGQLITAGDCGTANFGGVTGIQSAQIGIGFADTGATIAEGLGKFTGAVGKVLNAIPVVGAIADEILKGITDIFGHHGKAVKMERQVLCASSLQMNSAIDQVSQLVSSGNWNADQGVQELMQVYSGYDQTWKAEIPHSGEAPIVGWAFLSVIKVYQQLWSGCGA